MKFKGQRVLVTGCSSGIGKAQAEAFLAEGAEVWGLDQNACSIQDERFFFWSVDLGDVAAVEAWTKNLSPIDILCNTAGILDAFAPSLETSVAQFDQLYAVNMRACFLLCNAVLPEMLARQKGCIINMASIASLIPGGGGAAYTAMKHALFGYTKQLCYDYGHLGIRVNAIAPGAIATPMNAADFAGKGTIAKEIAQQVPLKRYAQAEEVAQLTLFLASPEAEYIQGDIVPIDGGWLNRQ